MTCGQIPGSALGIGAFWPSMMMTKVRVGESDPQEMAPFGFLLRGEGGDGRN